MKFFYLLEYVCCFLLNYPENGKLEKKNEQEIKQITFLQLENQKRKEW